MPAPEPIPDLLKAVNEASGKAFALWITFLTVGTYLAIAIGTTTHLQLLLAGPVKLPLLGVDLPLFAFYGFAPPLYLVLHLYVLMQLYLLARLLLLFDEQLQSARMLDQDRRITRGQLDKFVFTQFLIGAPQETTVRWFLRAVVWLSFVIGPLLLLFGFQFRFLPYHSLLVVNVHQVALMLDLALLLWFWPKISRGRVQQAPGPRAKFWRIVFACGIFIVLGVIDSVAIVHEASHALVLENERLVEQDEDKLSKLAVTLSLRGRDLRYGDFRGTDFRKADLSGANLADADLRDARLDEARLRFADLSRAELDGASLRGADLSGATLDGARDLIQAQLGQACGTDAKLPPDLTLEPCPTQ
jgi:Pentapeptide repeats (8 copies)